MNVSTNPQLPATTQWIESTMSWLREAVMTPAVRRAALVAFREMLTALTAEIDRRSAAAK